MSSEGLIKQLRDEIEGLRGENAGLRRLVAELGERNEQLRQEVGASEQRIAELEQAQKKPPSFVKRSKAKREGCKGARHPRAKEHNHGRKRVEMATRREEHHIERCPECSCKLRKKRVAWSREVIDLPPPQAVEVTEHVIFKGYCPKCATWQYARPGEPREVLGQRRFGTRLMTLIGYLTESLRLPYDTIKSYLKRLL
jgi:hypothetical protein